MNAPAFLFDLDGTLVDTVYQHVLAGREALEAAGTHRRIGMSGRALRHDKKPSECTWSTRELQARSRLRLRADATQGGKALRDRSRTPRRTYRPPSRPGRLGTPSGPQDTTVDRHSFERTEARAPGTSATSGANALGSADKAGRHMGGKGKQLSQPQR